MKSLNIKPDSGIFALTDYVLQQIHRQKPVTQWSSVSSDDEELSDESAKSRIKPAKARFVQSSD